MGQALSPAPALFMFRPSITLLTCTLLLGFVAPLSFTQTSQKAASPHVAITMMRSYAVDHYFRLHFSAKAAEKRERADVTHFELNIRSERRTSS